MVGFPRASSRQQDKLLAIDLKVALNSVEDEVVRSGMQAVAEQWGIRSFQLNRHDTREKERKREYLR